MKAILKKWWFWLIVILSVVYVIGKISDMPSSEDKAKAKAMYSLMGMSGYGKCMAAADYGVNNPFEFPPGSGNKTVGSRMQHLYKVMQAQHDYLIDSGKMESELFNAQATAATAINREAIANRVSAAIAYGYPSSECMDAMDAASSVEMKKVTPPPATPAAVTPAAPVEAPVAAPAPIVSQAAVVDSTPFSPSFDCAKASSQQEKLVCSDRELSKLDVQLSQAYTKAKDKSADVNALKKTQIDWIKSSRACSDKACLVDSYKKRISELQ